MCGIGVFASKSSSRTFSDKVESYLRSRGPDFYSSTKDVSVGDGAWTLTFCCSVLNVRGGDEGVCQQPLVNDRFIFGWNGEVYSGIPIEKGQSDTKALFSHMNKVLSSTCEPDAENDSLAVLDLLESLEAPFSMFLFDRKSEILYFGRDPIGRRSLVEKGLDDSFLTISSVLGLDEFGDGKEVDCGGVHVIQFLKGQQSYDRSFIPWKNDFIPLFNRHLPESFGYEDYDQAIWSFRNNLMDCVRKRIDSLPLFDSEVSILFSGGLDSLALALLIHESLSNSSSSMMTINLINVAFENPRFCKSNEKANEPPECSPSSSKYNVPDRKTGIKSFSALQQKYPNRRWRFIEVNVPFSEMQMYQSHISDLILPANTVMDFSIACALWFASRSVGVDRETGEKVICKSKVIFSGLGADELLAGYGRHRVVFKTKGWAGLMDEMEMDIRRISNRNLGRDDRVMSDNGKEIRFPFLDRNFISYICSLPIWLKCDLSQEAGIGDKKILRLMVSNIYGFRELSMIPKRAIQFGAKTAKMLDSKETGTQKLKN